MDVVAIIRIAMRALARNKLRSMLTMLGIIIGVGAVIAMVSVGQGAQQQAQQQIQAMGSNMLFVQSGTVNRGGMRMGGAPPRRWSTTTCWPSCANARRSRPLRPGSQAAAQVVFGNDNWATNINGTEPQYFDIRSWPFAEGTSFTQDDVSTAANVAVIGETVRKNLFGATDPIGQTIRINNLPFKVVGVLDPERHLSRHGPGPGRHHSCSHHHAAEENHRAGLAALDHGFRGLARRQLRGTAANHALLRDRHRIRAGQDDDFFVRNLADMADLADQQTHACSPSCWPRSPAFRCWSAASAS